jgi:hypothetical protein
MDYLVYISHDAENLQFFLWYRDYSKRFNALNEVERMFSPKWNQTLPTAQLHTLELAKSSTEPSDEEDETSAMQARKSQKVITYLKLY